MKKVILIVLSIVIAWLIQGGLFEGFMRAAEFSRTAGWENASHAFGGIAILVSHFGYGLIIYPVLVWFCFVTLNKVLIKFQSNHSNEAF